MSFIDPNSFSSYSTYSGMMPPPGPQPAVQQQGYGFPPPAYGGGYQYPSFNYGMPPYCPPPPPPPQYSGGGDNSGFTALIGQFMQLFIAAFMNGGLGGPTDTQAPPTEDPNVDDPNSTDGTHGSTPGGHDSTQPPGDPNQAAIQGEDPKTNSGALNILDVYSSDLPTKNGKVTLKDLKKFVKSPPTDAPDEVVQAAQTLVDNPELYDLLCLKSGSNSAKGFKTSVLSTDWSTTKLDIDNLESADDTESAAKKLNKVYTQLDALSGTATDGFTVDDLKDVALGKVSNTKLKDPEVQAAALKILSDQDTVDELFGDDELALQADLTTYINNNK